MAIIGTFTQTENGYTGHIRTLTCNVQAHFAPTENGNDKARPSASTPPTSSWEPHGSGKPATRAARIFR
jgi:hypothetical protein